MNTIDTLFSSIFAISLGLGALYMALALAVCYRDRNVDISNLSTMSMTMRTLILNGTTSGKIALMFLVGYVAVAVLFYQFGLTKTMYVTIVMGISGVVFSVLTFAMNVILRKDYANQQLIWR